MNTAPKETEHMTFFLASLEGGGIQKATMRLLRELIRRDIHTTLVVVNGTGPTRKDVPEGCDLVDLNCKRTRFALFALLKHLVREKPSIGISSQTHLNVLMIILRFLSGYPKHLVVREHNTFSEENINTGGLFERSRVRLIRYFYRFSSEFVAVSESVANSITEYAKYKKEIRVIRNGIDVNEVRELKNRPPDHPWLENASNKKLIVGIGRLSRQKNFPDLLVAFSQLRVPTQTRLLILGEGSELENLKVLSCELQIEDRVAFPGYIQNPYPILARADVFVSPSRWEGFGNVVLEALACGAPIVATDCPGGPADILEGNPYSRIVPEDEPRTMAKAIEELLMKKTDRAQVIQYAQQFSIEIIAQQYIDMISDVSRSEI
jgi:glycosyltransferase involved in cell wall biosynthesis